MHPYTEFCCKEHHHAHHTLGAEWMGPYLFYTSGSITGHVPTERMDCSRRCTSIRYGNKHARYRTTTETPRRARGNNEAQDINRPVSSRCCTLCRHEQLFSSQKKYSLPASYLDLCHRHTHTPARPITAAGGRVQHRRRIRRNAVGIWIEKKSRRNCWFINVRSEQIFHPKPRAMYTTHLPLTTNELFYRTRANCSVISRPSRYVLHSRLYTHTHAQGIHV